MKNTVLLLIAIVFVVSACAKTTPEFLLHELTIDNEAIVYIYRPYSLSNIVISPDVYVAGEKKLEIKNNSYMAIQLAAGQYEFNLDLSQRYEGQHSVLMSLSPGKQYFLRIDTAMKFQKNDLYKRRFDITGVSDETALSEIRECKNLDNSKQALARSEKASQNIPSLSTTIEKETAKSQAINDPDSKFTISKTKNPFAK